MDIITETMPAPREDLKPHAPRIVTVIVDKDQIGALIGPGGKIIQDMQEKSGATINIEEVDNKGIVDVSAIKHLHVFGLLLPNRRKEQYMMVL